MVSGAVFTAIRFIRWQWAATDSLLAPHILLLPVRSTVTRVTLSTTSRGYDPGVAKHAPFVIVRSGATKQSSLLWDDELITQL
jgi:hypothetical protein